MSKLIQAAAQMDWQQVVMNGGPPCFHLYGDGKFCGRAYRWVGHDPECPTHKFVSFEKLVADAQAVNEREEMAGILKRAIGSLRCFADDIPCDQNKKCTCHICATWKAGASVLSRAQQPDKPKDAQPTE